jgi:hypothetical protein
MGCDYYGTKNNGKCKVAITIHSKNNENRCYNFEVEIDEDDRLDIELIGDIKER